ncbi:MAG: 4-alpha-glucanotransferase [Gammaproteobacteria bacterium]|nr:MAG: 4-alpha-glucanotransferase [Gammaproteobacteria bacterium]
MKKISRLLAVAVVLLGFTIHVSADEGLQTNDLAIVGARIYTAPDAEPIEDGVVVIRGGKIAKVGTRKKVKIPRGIQVINAEGNILTAGFWNSHVHLLSPAQLGAANAKPEILSGELQAMLTQWGFTTVFDVASSTKSALALQRRIASGEVVGPNILTVGDAFYPKDGTPIYVRDLYATNGLASGEVATPEEASARAVRQLEAGTNGVKIFAGSIVGGAIGVLPMRVDIAKAIVDAAHQHGKLAFAHPSNMAGLKVAIEANVDVLAHPTAMDGGGAPGDWSPELIARMRSNNMALIPTLSLFEIEINRSGGNSEVVSKALDMLANEVRLYSGAGGQILFGTDVGYTDLYDTTREYQLLSKVLSWRQLLASLTTAPAEKFGFAAHKGKIMKGMDADLVLLADDPEKDSTAFANVKYTIRDGRVIWTDTAK